MKKNNNYLICNWILDPTQLTQMTQIFFVETKLTTYLQHFSIFKQDGARKPVLTLFTLFVFHVECQIFDWQILIQYFKSNSMHSLTSKDWQITDFSSGNTIYKCSIFTLLWFFYIISRYTFDLFLVLLLYLTLHMLTENYVTGRN